MESTNEGQAKFTGFDLGRDGRNVLQNIFDLFGVVDAEGSVTELSGRIFESTNTSPELLIGQRLTETVFWQSSENTASVLEKAIAKAAAGDTERITLVFRVSSEKKVPLRLELHPIWRDSASEPMVFIGGREVRSPFDENDGYKKQSEQLLFAAENVEIGLWFWDFAEDRIHSTSRCNELLGIPPYEAITYDIFIDAVHPEDRAFVAEFLRQSRDDGTRYEEEFRVVLKDETVEWVSVEGKSFLNDASEPERMLGTLRNVTRQKAAADELAKVHEREKKALDEAVEANRSKDLFLALISHELRSPLNAIQGWSKILLTKEVDEKTRVNALETIERSARFQTKIINDLVDSSRVASGKLKLEYRPSNLYDIVVASLNIQKPAAESRNVNLELIADRRDVKVFGDAGRLQQVFGNLISNAIKFTPPEGSVSVEITSDDETCTVRVSDTGIGISEKALPDIFRQFSQGDLGESGRSGGLGLGLSIVKILVERHGGTVRAESRGKGKGSTFIVTLPLNRNSIPEQPSQPAAITDEESEKHPLESIRILVVEDNHDSREVAQLFLEQNGAVVHTAQSASSAMEFIENATSQKPDIIISDIAMPDEDGYSFIKRVREIPGFGKEEVPALVLSAFSTKESRQQAIESGFQRYSTKPFEPVVLIADILDLVGKKSREA